MSTPITPGSAPQGEQSGAGNGERIVYVERPAEKKKRGGCMKWGLIVVGGLVVLGVVAGALGGNADEEGGSNPAGSSEGAALQGSSAEEAQAPEGEQPAAKQAGGPLEVGETFATKKGLEVTLSSLRATTDSLGQSFICGDVTYTNNGEKEADFQGYWDWKLQNPAGVITDPTFSMDEDMLEHGSLAPGGTVAGAVCFDGGEPGEYLLNFNPTLSFSTEKASWRGEI